MSFNKHVVPPKYTSDSSNELVAKYRRKEYDVEAVQITERNIEEVAKWCGGEVGVADDKTLWIDIPMSNANKPSRANLKDWVLKIPKAGKNRKDVFAIYNEYAFGRAFDKIPNLIELNQERVTFDDESRSIRFGAVKPIIESNLPYDEKLAEAVVAPLEPPTSKLKGIWNPQDTRVLSEDLKAAQDVIRQQYGSMKIGGTEETRVVNVDGAIAYQIGAHEQLSHELEAIKKDFLERMSQVEQRAIKALSRLT